MRLKRRLPHGILPYNPRTCYGPCMSRTERLEIRLNPEELSELDELARITRRSRADAVRFAVMRTLALDGAVALMRGGLSQEDVQRAERRGVEALSATTDDIPT